MSPTTPEPAGAHAPVLYALGRTLARAAVPAYFRHVEVLGTERLPASGPLVLAANHPQSITDALVLGWAVPRPLHFLAHSGLFRAPLLGRVLRRAGVLPVYRPREVEGAAAAAGNAETFRACREALEAGGVLAIFPEGVSRVARRLQPLKTGAARIVLEAEAAHGFALGVRLVPVGIAFETRTRFRTRVLVRIGAPLAAGAYREAHERDPREAVRSLTADLRSRLGDLIVDLGREELEALVADLEATYREELLERGAAAAAGSRFARTETLSREIARMVEFTADRRPELVWRIGRRLRAYQRLRERLRVSDRLVRGNDAPSRRRAAAALAASAAAGLPIAAYGALWNALPYKLTGRVARRRAADETKLHWHQLTWGALFYGLYYPPLLVAAGWILGPAGAAGFGASLVATGFFARWYAGRLDRRRETLRLAGLLATRGRRVQELRRRRRQLTEEIDAAVADVLAARAREGTPEEGT